MVVSGRDLDDAEESCLDSCLEAAQACEWYIDESVGGDMAECVRACRDAADLTLLCARFIARGSARVPEVAAACAAVCETCADICTQYDGAHVEACIETCTKCAETCRDMA